MHVLKYLFLVLEILKTPGFRWYFKAAIPKVGVRSYSGVLKIFCELITLKRLV